VLISSALRLECMYLAVVAMELPIPTEIEVETRLFGALTAIQRTFLPRLDLQTQSQGSPPCAPAPFGAVCSLLSALSYWAMEPVVCCCQMHADNYENQRMRSESIDRLGLNVFVAGSRSGCAVHMEPMIYPTGDGR
jgi:hypothetical protein